MRRFIEVNEPHVSQRMEIRGVTLIEAEWVLNNYHTDRPGRLPGTRLLVGEPHPGRHIKIWVTPLGDSNYRLNSVAEMGA